MLENLNLNNQHYLSFLILHIIVNFFLFTEKLIPINLLNFLFNHLISTMQYLFVM